jgi:hypothetical protein
LYIDFRTTTKIKLRCKQLAREEKSYTAIEDVTMNRRTINLLRWRWILLIGLVSMTTVRIVAQEQQSGVTLSGNVSLGYDLYDLDATAGSTMTARRPSSLLRLLINPTISFGESFSLPFSFIITIPETTTMLSKPASPGFMDFLQNPANSLSMAPKFGWAQFKLGSQTPQMSELSGGDIQIFGFGMDLTPGSFRIAASAGTVGRSVAADTVHQIRGEYARQAYMGKIAYVDGQTEIGLNVVRIRDDGASIPTLTSSLTFHPDSANPSLSETIDTRHPLMPLPEESLTATLNVRVPIADGLRVRGEVGGSLFTRDMTADKIAEPISAIEPLMAQHLSTRADVAGKAAIDVKQQSWGVSLSSTYIGVGYRTLAYPWMQADRLDVTIAPHVELLDDNLSLSGSFGWRQNNLSALEETTTSQLLGSLNIDARIGDVLAINGQYSNYGLRTPVKNDTLRVETVAQSLSLTPTVTLVSDDIMHVLTASAAIDDYSDYNPITGADGSNRTKSVMGMYSASLTAIPLTADISGSWLLNQLNVGDLTITSASLGAGYKLFDGNVTLGANGSVTRTALGTDSPDEGVTLRLNGTWRITKSLRLRADASTTSHHYGDSRPGASFRENLLRTSVQWQW